MPAEEQNVDNKPEVMEQVPPAEAKKTEEHLIPKSRLDDEIQKRKDLEKRLAAMEKAHNDAETQRLQEQKDYQTLYEKAAAELAEAKPKAEKLDVFEATLKETLASAIEEIPPERRGLIPEELSTEAQLRWIAKNRALLAKAQPFDIGAGKKGGEAQKTVELTEDEKAFALRTGVSFEDYAKYKKKP